MKFDSAETLSQTLASMARGRMWNQSDLAAVLGWSVQGVSDLLNGRRRIDVRDALDLSAALGGTAEEWLQHQIRDELNALLAEPSSLTRLTAIRTRSELESVVPVRELVRRGFLPAKDAEHQKMAALELLEVDDLRDPPEYPLANRRHVIDQPISRQQRAWIACARRIARNRAVGPFDSSALESLGTSLSTTVVEPGHFLSLPERFAEVGVPLVYVESFPGGRIEGMCSMLDGVPMIALSGRGGRFDRVLFTLAHEAAHIVLGHLEEEGICIQSGEESADRYEKQADALAARWLLPGEFDQMGFYTSQRVAGIARSAGVSEAVVVGRLQKLGLVPWNSILNRRIPSVKEELSTWN